MTAPVRRRTRAREIAMQVLFQFDLRGSGYADELGTSVRELCRQEWLAGVQADEATADAGAGASKSGKGARGGEQEVVAFAQRLVEGTLQHRDEIDQRLQAVTRNWDLKRMAIVDRNVLRMSVYELLYCADVPPKVAINEAIEIGKRFSTANSGGFVNGILDRIRIDVEQERRVGGASPGHEAAQAADGASGDGASGDGATGDGATGDEASAAGAP